MKPDAGGAVGIRVGSRRQTVAVGEALAACLRAGDLVALDGDLGAGKTAMAEGIARGLGVRGPVASPTFSLLHPHPAGRPGGLALYHADAYRLNHPDEFGEAGLDDILYQGGVTLVEWASLLDGVLPADRIRVDLLRVCDDEFRSGMPDETPDRTGEEPRWIRIRWPAGREDDREVFLSRLSALPDGADLAPGEAGNGERGTP